MVHGGQMALRRQVRLRKEYIYRKSLQGKEAAIYEDKQRVREALRDGTPLPTELRAVEAALRHQVGTHTSSHVLFSVVLTSFSPSRRVPRRVEDSAIYSRNTGNMVKCSASVNK